MELIQIDDLKFKPFISEKEIQEKVQELALEIGEKYKDKNPLFICVLNGSFMFTADLLKHISFPYEIEFVRLASYEGTSSTESIKELLMIERNIENRHLIIIEDIVETGLTLNYLIERLSEKNPVNISLTSLLFKPNCLKVDSLPLDYVGFKIDDAFVVGYGLDYNQKGRHLRAIYQLEE